MDQQQQATEQARESRDSLSTLITQPDNGTPTKPATEQQLQNVEKEMTGFERSTVRLARLAVFVSIVAAIFVCAQWWEMHTTGIDTHDLAVAAQHQADAAKKLAEQAESQTAKMGEALAKTDKLITEATNQAKATNDLARQARRSASTAEQSLTLARQSLEAQERPWIVPLLMQLSNEPESGKKFTVRVTILNSGRTPAVDLINQSNLYFWVGGVGEEPPITSFLVPPHAASRALVPPGSTNVSFTSPEWEWNGQQLTLYKENKNAKLYIHAIIRYRSSSGERYWTRICGYHTSGDALDDFRYCENGNEVGHGDVPAPQ